jgi:hypothetical protein
MNTLQDTIIKLLQELLRQALDRKDAASVVKLNTILEHLQNQIAELKKVSKP